MFRFNEHSESLALGYIETGDHTMKRMQLIAAALCLMMITTVGAGAVAAKQTENPRQAGASQVYIYNLAPADGHGKGILKIDTKQNTYLFNGQGFAPSQVYILEAKTASGDAYVFGSMKSTAAGNAHAAGKWSATAAAQPSLADFRVGLLPGKSTPYSGTIQRTSLDDKDYDLVFTDASNQKVTIYLDPSEISPNTLPPVIANPVPVTIFINDAYSVTFYYNNVAYTAPWYTTTLNPYYTYEAHYKGTFFTDYIFGTVWLNTWDTAQHKFVQTGAEGGHVQVWWFDQASQTWLKWDTGSTDNNGHFCVKESGMTTKGYKVDFIFVDWSASTGTLSSTDRPSYC
ncbi:MAG: hypothetical protein ACXV76_08030 [Halobacteriota archaeon]